MSLSKVPKARFRIFVPILAGATLRERLFACLGALIAIGLTGLISGYIFGQGPHLPLIVAPMGASAVLLFAVPASPLAQPWSIIGGNTISASMGILAAYLIRDPVIAIGVGVSLAIGAMSVTRCLHPPGGAAALTAVLGGPAVTGWGLLFPFIPVGLNSCILVGLGLVFHRLARRSYPHAAAKPVNTHQTADPPPSMRTGFDQSDVDAALAALDETFDIGRDDIGRLLRQVEQQVLGRIHGDVSCREIMSRDVVSIDLPATPAQAQALLLKHNIRTLPVRDGSGRLAGTVGLRELAKGNPGLEEAVSEVATAGPDDAALSLLPVLTDGRSHAVIIVDPEGQIVGLISQTDLLCALARILPASGPAQEMPASIPLSRLAR
ncbi:HPP family protein [Pararhizobium gei]|uniref:HPP family protein n=1 Tax=Pararhizobium gei TaxID=1395951 RepID=UPI0023DAE68F|nr:HPP family protein [Rhizobium gei]